MSRHDRELYVPYVSGAVWVVRHAHTVVAWHASRHAAIEDARRRAAIAALNPSGSDGVCVKVQADDGTWHLLDTNTETSNP